LAWKCEPHFTASPHILQDRECGDQPCFKVHTCCHKHNLLPGGHTQQNMQQNILTTRLKFLTLEKNCIKIWEYFSGNAELLKKIHIKQQIK
jgi:hypothetical protein